MSAELRVKFSHEKAKFFPPVHPGDVGYDVACLETVVVPKGKDVSVSTGVYVEIPEGYWGRLTGRSSTLGRYKCFVVDGVIDQGYRGELFVRLVNHTSQDRLVPAGEKVAQLLLHKSEVLPILHVDELSPSPRGEKGFGSTDAKPEKNLAPPKPERFYETEKATIVWPDRVEEEGTEFVKDDKGKPRFDLVPPHALAECAATFTSGAVKYGEDNWRKAGPAGRARILGALGRHYNRYLQGGHFDNESGLHHLTHAAACALMLAELDLTKDKK